MIRRVFFGLAVAAALAALVLAAGFWWLSRSGLPQRSGVVTLEVLDEPVEVRWNDFGVPHVRAAAARDAAAALGWLHANDRMVQLELGRRLAAGRLAEIVGEVALPSDRYFRSLGMRRIAERNLDALGPESRSLLEAYSAGVNAWLAQRGSDLPPELRLLGVEPEPWVPLDSLFFQLQMAHELSFWQARPEEDRFRWLAAIGPGALADLLGHPDLFVAPEIVELAGHQSAFPGPSGPGTQAGTEFAGAASPGSNNWAVGASRSATGAPIVANDPHLPLALPAVWYQVRITSPDYDAAGMTLPGLPFVVLGQGPDLAWAFTNVMLDDHDLFFEQLAEDGARVRRDDGWAPVEITIETIRVDGADDETQQVRFTDRGVLLEADPARGLPARSMAWTAAVPGDAAAVFLQLARAHGVDELIGQLDPYVAPAQNLVAADRHGGLLYTPVGRVPLRLRGDGRMPSPAWTSSYGWGGLLPQQSNPTLLRPADDLIVTANSDLPLSSDEPRESPLTADFDTPHRARRIHDLLLRRQKWEPAEMARVQYDIYSYYARDLVELLAGDYDGDAGRAWNVLSSWDGAMTVDGAAALFPLVERELLRAIFADEASAHGLPSLAGRDELLRVLGGGMEPAWFDDVTTDATESRAATLAAALEAAWRDAVARWGQAPGTWNYGDLHALTLRHPLGALPMLGGWLNRGPIPMPGSATTVAAFGGRWGGDRQDVAYGPSMRWISDSSDGDRTLAVLPSGQSGHPADRHYDDQLALYLAGQLRPVHWSEAAIEANTVSRLTLSPR